MLGRGLRFLPARNGALRLVFLVFKPKFGRYWGSVERRLERPRLFRREQQRDFQVETPFRVKPCSDKVRRPRERDRPRGRRRVRPVRDANARGGRVGAGGV